MVLRKVHLDYRKKRISVIVLAVLLLLMIYLFEDASTWLRVLSIIIIMCFFYVADHVFDIRFKYRHYVFMLAMLIIGFLFSPLYFVYANFDKLQHFFLPMLTASIFFFMINKLHLELKWKIVFTFFAVVTVLGVFEIAEYGLDSLFNLKLQGVYLRDTQGLEKFNLLMDPLSDTISDMIYGMIGTAIYCIVFAFFMKRKLQQHLFRDF